MKCNKIFLFPIQTKDLFFHFRLLKLSIFPEVDKAHLEMILNKAKSELSSRIWKQSTQGVQSKWSALIRIEGEPYIAIPVDLHYDGLEIPFPKMNRTVSLSDSDRINSFSFNNPEPSYQELALRWLEDNLRIILTQHSSQLWNLGNIYFSRHIINFDTPNREIDIFPGFSLKIYPRNNNEYALCVSECVKYVDTKPLKWYIDQGISIKQRFPRHGIYKNGSNWYGIQIIGETGISISKTIIPKLGASVYQYIKRDAHNRSDLDISLVDPNTPAFEYQYPNRPETKYFANAAWAYFTFSTNDPEVRHLHSLSKKKPEQRLENVQLFVKEFFSKSDLPISSECESITPRVFPIPTLVFGNNHKLRINGSNSNTNHEKPGTSITAVETPDWFLSKKRVLFQQGVYKKGIVLPQHLIVPVSMDQMIVDIFQEDLVKFIENITNTAYQFTSVSTYPVPKRATSLSSHYQAIEQVVKEQNLLCDQDATIVLVLPAKAPSRLHDHLKALFEKERVRSQFLVESYPDDKTKFGVCDFFVKNIGQGAAPWKLSKGSEGRYKSYVQNIALGILLNNRRWLYRLDKPLHHDLIIGLDISNRMVGLSLYDGEHGDLIFTFDFSGKTIKDRRYRLEKLNENIMMRLVYNFLKEGTKKLQLRPKSIVIHRDGRTFESEWLGFNKAISALQKEGALDSDVRFGIMEVYKSSVSMPRIVSLCNGKVKNPKIGTYEFINSYEAILCNTGFPARLDGTAHPLLIRQRFGNINFQHALHDIFNLSNLCYAAPDKPQSLPITLKIIDDLLTPLAYDIESPGYEESDEEHLEGQGEDIEMKVSYPTKSRMMGAGL